MCVCVRMYSHLVNLLPSNDLPQHTCHRLLQLLRPQTPTPVLFTQIEDPTRRETHWIAIRHRLTIRHQILQCPITHQEVKHRKRVLVIQIHLRVILPNSKQHTTHSRNNHHPRRVFERHRVRNEVLRGESLKPGKLGAGAGGQVGFHGRELVGGVVGGVELYQGRLVVLGRHMQCEERKGGKCRGKTARSGPVCRSASARSEPVRLFRRSLKALSERAVILSWLLPSHLLRRGLVDCPHGS